MVERDEHGHFVKSEPKSAPLPPPPPVKAAAKASGWKYLGVLRDGTKPIYVHRWIIDDPTGAPLVFTVGTADEKACEADAIKEHKARFGG